MVESGTTGPRERRSRGGKAAGGRGKSTTADAVREDGKRAAAAGGGGKPKRVKQTRTRKSPARTPAKKASGAKSHGNKTRASADRGADRGAGRGPGRGSSQRPPLTRARARANARSRRKRGATGAKLRVLAMALASLLVVSLVGGGLLGITLDRSGLFDRMARWSGLPIAPAGSAPATFAAMDVTAPPATPPATPRAAPAALPRRAAVASFAAFDPADFVARRPAETHRVAAALPAASVQAEASEQQAARPLPPLGSVGAVSLAALVAQTLTQQVATATPRGGLPRSTGSELHVVYEEPLAARDLMPRPSEQALDSFMAERRIAGRAFDGAAQVGSLPWQRNAVQVADIGERPMIALVLDDLGLNRPATRRAVALPAPLTLAFMTYAENIGSILADARSGGHELLVHMPMEPRDHGYDPGPNVLSVELSAQQIAERIDWGLQRFDGYVGVNNHMGSRFTTSLSGMAQVMEELRRRGLLFLDSKTADASVGGSLAERMGVPYAERDIFIDNDFESRAAIERQLDALEALARRRGFAVGIGHPHDVTLDVLERWLPAVQRRGIALVPISAVVNRRIELARASEHAG